MSSKSDRPTSGNRRSVTKDQVKRMCPQQRARYLAYEEPPKEAKTSMAMSRQRVRTRLADEKKHQPMDPCGEKDAAQRRQEIVGQMKAAEARNRIRQMRLQYMSIRAQEINIMISCQSSAQTAVRLELVLLPAKDNINAIDFLDKQQRRRVEEILEDEKGLTVYRG